MIGWNGGFARIGQHQGSGEAGKRRNPNIAYFVFWRKEILIDMDNRFGETQIVVIGNGQGFGFFVKADLKPRVCYRSLVVFKACVWKRISEIDCLVESDA